MDGMMAIEEYDHNSDQEGTAYRVKEPKIYTRAKIPLLFDYVYVLLREAF